MDDLTEVFDEKELAEEEQRQIATAHKLIEGDPMPRNSDEYQNMVEYIEEVTAEMSEDVRGELLIALHDNSFAVG